MCYVGCWQSQFAVLYEYCGTDGGAILAAFIVKGNRVLVLHHPCCIVTSMTLYLVRYDGHKQKRIPRLTSSVQGALSSTAHQQANLYNSAPLMLKV